MQLGSEPWIPDKQILEICHCRSETILLTPNSSCEACSAFTRVAACTLARSPYFVTRYPKASDISSPPCLLRLLPAGAVAGWDLHPLESAAFSRRTPLAGHYGRKGRVAPFPDIPERPLKHTHPRLRNCLAENEGSLSLPRMR